MAYISQQPHILQNMIDYLENYTNWPDCIPKLTDFSKGSVLYTLLNAIATAIDSNAYAIYMAKQAAFLSTATGSDLDNKAADFGIIRKPAVSAKGIFTFTKLVTDIASVQIPAGSLISTLPDSAGNVITYSVDSDSVLPAGQLSVSVACTCQTSGVSGNISANTKLLISSAVPGIDGVQLISDIRNGVDTETDDQLRVRALNAFASLARGTDAWYKSIALGVPGVQSATVVPQNRGAGTVDIFIVGANNTIPDATLQSAVQAALDTERPVTDDAREQVPTIAIINATFQVHVLAGYDTSSICTAVTNDIKNFINNLGVGAGGLGHIYASKLISVGMGVNGVANITTTFTDMTVAQFQLPQAGTISVAAV